MAKLTFKIAALTCKNAVKKSGRKEGAAGVGLIEI